LLSGKVSSKTENCDGIGESESAREKGKKALRENFGKRERERKRENVKVESMYVMRK
jgi:hypothetical protein